MFDADALRRLCSVRAALEAEVGLDVLTRKSRALDATDAVKRRRDSPNCAKSSNGGSGRSPPGGPVMGRTGHADLFVSLPNLDTVSRTHSQYMAAAHCSAFQPKAAGSLAGPLAASQQARYPRRSCTSQPPERARLNLGKNMRPLIGEQRIAEKDRAMACSGARRMRPAKKEWAILRCAALPPQKNRLPQYAGAAPRSEPEG